MNTPNHPATAALALAACAATAAADFGSDFAVGRTADNALAVEFNFGAIEPIPESPDPFGFNGFFSDEPGFASFPENEPDEGLFRLAPGAQIRFTLLSADPGFVVFNPDFSAPLNPGDSFDFEAITGDAADESTWSNFDDHPWWTVSRDDPAFDASIFSYTVSFELSDVGSTGYASTGPITVTFSRVPAPASLALLAAAPLCTRRRRR